MTFRKFTLKHITLVTLVPAIAVWGVLTAIFYTHPENSAYNGLAGIGVMFLISFGLKKYNSTFMKKAERELYDGCDPYPMLDEIDLYLECASKRANKTGLHVTRAVLLTLAGKYEDAEQLLKSFNTGADSPLPATVKSGVLYDLASLYCAMNMRQHAIESYDRSREIISSEPEAIRQKIPFDGMTSAQVECFKGNADLSLEMLEKIEPENNFHEVMKTFASAKIHYIIGRREEALSEFDFVAENGGKLACAAESEEISRAARAAN